MVFSIFSEISLKILLNHLNRTAYGMSFVVNTFKKIIVGLFIKLN